MTPNKSVVISLAFLCLATCAQAQQAIVAPSRSIDWTQNVAVTYKIPTRNTIYQSIRPYTGTADIINSALASCPSGQVVFLSGGTFLLSTGIDFKKSNCTLRGAGPDQTQVVFTGFADCGGLGADVCMSNGPSGDSNTPAHLVNWTAGYTKGAAVVTLSSVAGLSVGDSLWLDQLDDSNVDNGTVWNCQAISICSSEGGSGGRSNRGQLQISNVTAINGTNVTITPPLRMPNWSNGRSPQAWSFTPIHDSGIENLTLDHTNSSAQHSVRPSACWDGVSPTNLPCSGINIFNGFHIWVKNVRSIKANRNAVWLYETAGSVVRDSYFTQVQGDGSQSYGIESYMSTDNLVENNIFQHLTVPLMTGNAVGTVFAYNFAIDDIYSLGSWQQASHYFHDSGVGMILLEGNDGIGMIGDNIHGTQFFITAFRNYWNGRDPNGGSIGGKTQQTSAVIIMAGNRYYNLVGNVFGTPGYHTNYECSPASSSTPSCVQNANVSVYAIGWSNNEGSKDTTLPNDTLVRSTLMRWGNYDTVTGPNFLASEVPSGLSQFGNPMPQNQTLPSSFYLPAKPFWWGAIPWPAIGPDVTQGQGPAGHAYKIPAHECYDSTSRSGNILNFNAASCYAQAGPSAPTNLSVVLGAPL